MKMSTARATVRGIAAEVGGSLRTDYSGRGMFGASCYGIVTDDATNCIEIAAEHGIKGARTDGMGLKTIVYWTHIHEDARDAAGHDGNEEKK